MLVVIRRKRLVTNRYAHLCIVGFLLLTSLAFQFLLLEALLTLFQGAKKKLIHQEVGIDSLSCGGTASRENSKSNSQLRNKDIHMIAMPSR